MTELHTRWPALLLVGVAVGASAAASAIGVRGPWIAALGPLAATALVAKYHRWEAGRIVLGSLLAAAFGVSAAWILREVLGAGYPAIRAAADGPLAVAALTVVAGALAVLDHPPRKEGRDLLGSHEPRKP